VPVTRSKPYLASILAAMALVACAGSGESSNAAGGARTDEAGDSGSATETTDGASATATSSTANVDDRLGPPLASPERYYGVYANPATPNREWFVTEAKRPEYADRAPEVPPGHLAIGAMFGDVAPWYMRTLSETTFEESWVPDSQPGPVTVEFELDGEGHAVAMTFTGEMFPSEGRLERVRDLPEEWR